MQLITALQPGNEQQTTTPAGRVRSGLTVHSNLRGGLAWDQLDDQAAAFWKQLTDNFAGMSMSPNATTSQPASK
jgi:hypothetical protein